MGFSVLHFLYYFVGRKENTTIYGLALLARKFCISDEHLGHVCFTNIFFVVLFLFYTRGKRARNQAITMRKG